MTEFLPFKGILYNNSAVRGTDVLAPPYDIITPEIKEELYDKSDYNIVRIDFGKAYPGDDISSNKYSRASHYLSEWLSKGILRKHDKEAFYVYETEYYFSGKKMKLRGIIGKLRLRQFGEGIYPHEETHSAPKEDRLKLMRTCGANISPIFSLYNSPDRIASGIMREKSSEAPYMEGIDDLQVIHRLWIVDDESAVRAISEDISGKSIFIADGHHRYETALAYQKEMRISQGISQDAPFDYVMMSLFNIADSGLTILPTHRLIDKAPDNLLDLLSPYFEISAINTDTNIMQVIAEYDHAIGMYLHTNDNFYLLRPMGIDLEELHPALRELDVVVLHELIFSKLINAGIITYEMDAWRCMDMVKKGKHQAVFFLNPTKVQDIERVARNSLRMPPKSTYFYPKLLTGFVINPF